MKQTQDLTFEEALSELQEIVKGIETGREGLEKIIANYERGNALKKHCEDKLKEAKLRVEKIIEKPLEDGGSSLSLEEVK